MSINNTTINYRFLIMSPPDLTGSFRAAFIVFGDCASRISTKQRTVISIGHAGAFITGEIIIAIRNTSEKVHFLYLWHLLRRTRGLSECVIVTSNHVKVSRTKTRSGKKWVDLAPQCGSHYWATLLLSNRSACTVPICNSKGSLQNSSNNISPF